MLNEYFGWSEYFLSFAKSVSLYCLIVSLIILEGIFN